MVYRVSGDLATVPTSDSTLADPHGFLAVLAPRWASPLLQGLQLLLRLPGMLFLQTSSCVVSSLPPLSLGGLLFQECVPNCSTSWSCHSLPRLVFFHKVYHHLVEYLLGFFFFFCCFLKRFVYCLFPQSMWVLWEGDVAWSLTCGSAHGTAAAHGSPQ